MKKITTKTITFHAEYNYGAVLQAYSLQQYLIGKDIDNEIIDMRGRSAIGIKKFFSRKFTFKTIILNLISLLHVFKICSYRKKMKSFVESNFLLTKRYLSFEELNDSPPQADYFISGSDQVWNIVIEIRKEFFLEFVSKGKKISYAASLGVSSLDDYGEHYISKCLSDFKSISIREQTGVKILQRAGIKNVQGCIDPVFLNSKSFWVEKCKSKNSLTPKKKYILVYCLAYDPDLERCIHNTKIKYKLPVYVISPNGYTRIKHCKKIINAGPLEFLNLLMNAEYIITSSFHGLAFSIIFQKKFLAFANKLTGSRINDLLLQTDLQKNTIKNQTDISVADKIDYNKVSFKLVNAIKSSENFLSEALNE